MAESIRGDTPLKNKKHELFCINLMTMSRGEACSKAGYKQEGDNASKYAERLLTKNNEVLDRYKYLINKHNIEMEEKGFISREKMIIDALHMKNVCMGRSPNKMIAKHREHEFVSGPDGETAKNFHEYYTEEEVFGYDIKSFTPLWDKLMNALDYYPKENEVDIDDPVYIATILKKMPKEKLEVLMNEFSKDD